MADTLPERVTRYLNRHIAWMQESLDALSLLPSGLEPEAQERLVQQDSRRQDAHEQFLREQRALLREWRASEGGHEADRAGIQELAREADRLRRELQKRYEEVAGQMQREMAGCRETINALRRGRDMLGKYRPGGLDEPGFVDKKA